MPFDLQTATPQQILEHILADGVVDAAEVELLEKYIEHDWRIDRHEAELMLDISRKLSSSGHACPGWQNLFVEAVTRVVVFDMNSPGEVDKDEGDWLGEQMTKGPIAELQWALLEEICKTSTKISGKLADVMKSAGVK